MFTLSTTCYRPLHQYLYSWVKQQVKQVFSSNSDWRGKGLFLSFTHQSANLNSFTELILQTFFKPAKSTSGLSLSCLCFRWRPCMTTHFLYGGLQEVVQQVACFSQRAGADHHWGVHRVQLILQRTQSWALPHLGQWTYLCIWECVCVRVCVCVCVYV